MKNIAIFASGSGTNAQAIMERFEQNKLGGVKLLLSNNSDAYALKRAEKFAVATLCFSAKEMRENPQTIIDVLRQANIDLIVLAGFMLLIPSDLVAAFEGQIINIHPALLPAYGGKGMYGDNVHRAVIAAGEHRSGITIHYVTSQYDKGSIIFQATVDIEPTDTPDTLAAKIHKLEHRHFPEVIEQLCDEK